MNIVIPMAGKGSRFAQSGFTLPKPLINVAGKPMYQHAVECMPLQYAKKLIFIIKKNEFSQEIENNIKAQYEDKYDIHILVLNKDTEGQAETILKSEKILNLEDPILIHNCDTYVSPLAWENHFKLESDGAIVLFNSNENRWSYAELNNDKDKIIQFREKKVISTYASSGTYFFKNSYKLLKNIEKIISKNIRENNEFYLSTIYQLMIEEQDHIVPLFADKILCFGTPQDLVTSLNKMLEFCLQTEIKND